jgi:hypothetical protein
MLPVGEPMYPRDIDKSSFGTCGTSDLNKSVIKGIVLTKDGQPVPG